MSSRRNHWTRRGLLTAGIAVAAVAAAGVATAAPAFASATPVTYDTDAPSGQVWGIEAGAYDTANGFFVAPPTSELTTQGAQVATTAGVQDGIVSVSSDWQKWVITPSTGANAGYYTISNRMNGMCLDVQGASTAAGAPVIQWPCSGNNNQQWQIIWTGYPNGTGNSATGFVVEFQNENSGLLLSSGSTAGGSTLAQESVGYTGGNASFTLNREGYALTTNPVTVPGGAFVSGTAACVEGYHFAAANNQQLSQEESGDSYTAAASSAGDIPAGNTALTEAVATVPAGNTGTANLTFWHSTTPYDQQGQLTLYCDPGSVTS
jgi:hypothetical protein